MKSTPWRRAVWTAYLTLSVSTPPTAWTSPRGCARCWPSGSEPALFAKSFCPCGIGFRSCRYCMPCPKGVDIPGTFRCWNTMYTESKQERRTQYMQTVGLTKEPAFASQCIRCGKCEQHCPQSIPIRDKLQEADKDLRPLIYKVAIHAARAFMFRKTRENK
ncbi:MAG: 4Fe-4S dicluster domain-containing protein [Oscillospiraceae bacterium]|nr:4Fe-4S dicluster domain-containing protein [Oscillospiraceae bacterium]